MLSSLSTQNVNNPKVRWPDQHNKLEEIKLLSRTDSKKDLINIDESQVTPI